MNALAMVSGQAGHRVLNAAHTFRAFLGGLMLLSLPACSLISDKTDECCTLSIKAKVAEETRTVYMSGNINALGPWRPDGLALRGEGSWRSVSIDVPRGTELEYKFTLGTWDREALGPSGTVMPNFKLFLDQDKAVDHVLDRWRADPREYMADWRGSGVQGTLVYWQDMASDFLDLSRHVVIWLPPGYDPGREEGYPVLYMHDGQNLFDPRLGGSKGNIWDVDDAVIRLARQGVIPEIVVVGAFNTADRMWEYSPWHRAADYARFLIEELMPRVNSEFNTRPGPQHTGVMGSSMGGLASYHMVTQHPEVFGSCGCVSSHFPLNEAVLAAFTGIEPAGDASETPFIVRDIEAGLTFPKGVRYWFDYGTEGLDGSYGPPHDALRQAFLDQGWEEGVNFVIREYQGADHNEASWRDRLEDPLIFMFGDR